MRISELPTVDPTSVDPTTDVSIANVGGATCKILLKDLVSYSAYDSLGNIFLGPDTLAANVIGQNNVALGDGALQTAVNPSNTIAIGKDAAGQTGVITDSIAIGTNALKVSQAETNVAIGHETLKSNTFGQFNCAVGSWGLQGNTTGNFNTSIGVNALSSVTTGSLNTGVGAWAAQDVTTQSQVTAVGTNGLRFCAQEYCTAVGANALANYTTGSDGPCDAFGSSSQENNLTGGGNLSAGAFSLYSTTTGSRNVALGNSSMNANLTGFGNTAAGYAALSGTENGSLNVAFGYQVLDNAQDVSPYYTTDFTSSGYIDGTTFNVLSVTGTIEVGDTLDGTGVYFPTTIVQQLTGTPGGIGTYEVSYAQMVGTVGSPITITGGPRNTNPRTWNNICLGYRAAAMAGSAENTVVIGGNALERHTEPSSVVAIGPGTLANNGGANNCAVGPYSMSGVPFDYPTEAVPDPVNPNTGSYNTSLGVYNLIGLTTGANNTCVGFSAGVSIVDTDNNTAIGKQALRDNAAWNNTAIGAEAGLLSSGSNNVLIGRQAGATYGPAPDYTFLGITSGYRAVMVGAETQPNAGDDFNFIAIGYQAIGKGSNTAAIGNSDVKAVALGGATTVGALPSAATMGAGARAFVTDANATTFLSVVAAGGTSKVPVVSDGTNWLIG